MKRPRDDRPALIALALALAVGVAGCSEGSPVEGAARQAAAAACRQAADGINDPAARKVADDACRAGAEGNVKDASDEAKRTARQRCLDEADKVVDPAARREVRVLCPDAP